MRAFLAVVSVIALVAIGMAQQAASPPSPGGQAVPHTVHIDALAVDGRGQVLPNLKASEFELREDGRVLPVDEARFMRIDAAAAADPPQPVSSHADEQREAGRANTRLVAIFLDEYHISPVAAERTRQALTDLIDRALGPRDLIVVMKPLDSLFTIRLTHDRDEARRIVAGLEARKGDYTPHNAYERNYWAGTPARIEVARNQIVVSALTALSTHLGGLGDGRKTLFVVTESIVGEPNRRGQEFLATVDSIVRSANRANVSIYPVDPRSPASAEASATDSNGSTDVERATLKRLAADTSGQWISGVDDLSASVRRASDEANAYYLLTYRSTHKEDGGFHPVQVRVSRPGIQIRMRPGYWAPSIDDRLVANLLARASAPPPPLKLEPARHISPLIQPWFGMSRGSNGKTRVSFVWEPSLRVPGDRSLRAPSRLVLTALGSDDSVLFEGPVRPTGPGTMEEADGMPARAVFDVPPGRLRLRMRVEDAALQPLDADVRDIAIRDLSKGVTIATPEIMRARNEREFRALGDDPNAVPVSAREFSRTEHLLVRFVAYSPGGQTPVVAAKLLNRGGQVMRTLDIEPGPHGEHQFDLLLSAFAAGEYRLELTASSAAGDTREFVDFRVTS
jgi:VWFA-related protein